MSNKVKPLEELNVLDDFLMSAITNDPDVGVPFCRTLLSVLLQRKIGKVRIISQRSIPALTPELRGIRMDVEVEEAGVGEVPAMNVYDLEPHLQNDLDLPRHNRFYQAKIDSRYLKSGEKNFSKLPNLYILTITDFDPFGQDYMVYRVRNKFEDIPEMEYEDGLRYLYYYTEGKKGGSPEIGAVLRYLQESTLSNVTDGVVQKIHRYVTDVKVRPEVKFEYMTFEEYVELQKYGIARKTRKETMVEAIVDLLEEFGEVPESVREKLMKKEPEYLRRWLKLAAKAESLEVFIQQLDTGNC